MPEKFLVDIWVKEYSEAGSTKAFCPDAVAKDTGLSVCDVFERLLFLVSDGRLVLQWEVRCPACGEVILREHEVNCNNFWCSKCKKLVEVFPNVIYPLFSVTPEYKEHVTQNRFRHFVFSSALSRKKQFNTRGDSQAVKAPVSKTGTRGFESLPSCQSEKTQKRNELWQ